LLVIFCKPISQYTFGTGQHAGGIALLSLAVLFREVSAGQAALVQGLRRISDLARMSVLAGLFGTLLSIPIVYAWGESGIVPSLVAVATVSVLVSWWYSRKAPIRTPSMTLGAMSREASALLKLGFAFMASGFLAMGAAYVIRIIVLRTAGFEAAGLYQAAWALGGLYVGFILQAMGTDFYPRLAAVSKDNTECNRLVNEQAHISLLLAGPGVIATLTFAQLVIAAFYSPAFGPAVDLLRWICLGMTLRVVTFPMGFIVVAKGAQQILFWTEVAAFVVHVGSAWLFVTRFGLNGSGAAFFALYVWHGLLIYAIVRRVSGFRWSAANRNLGVGFLLLTAAVFSGFYLFPSWVAIGIGTIATVASGIYSLRCLLTFFPSDSISQAIRTWLLRVGRPVEG